MRLYIGIDNGVSGSIGVIKQDKSFREYNFFETPTFSQQDYTKTKKNVTRIDYKVLKKRLHKLSFPLAPECIFVALERPMVNPGRFKATTSAMRAMEATLITLDLLGNGQWSFQWLDSKEWQKVLLPSGLKGPELKTASRDIGMRLFPRCKNRIKKHKDADGLLIAEYCRRTYR